MTSESLLDQAALCLQKGDLWRAEFLYRQVIQLKPDNATVFFNYGNVLYALQRPHDALESYGKALAISPNHLDALNNRAVLLCALDRFEEALVTLDRAVALNPVNPLAQHNRGVALAGLERFDQAVNAYDAAIALVPNHAGAWNNRGAALSKLRRFSEAVESYDRALSIDPGRADTYVNRGCALGELKRFAQALASHDKALSLNPRSADALYNRGVALTELKRIEEAMQSYKQCVALEPNYPKAAYNLSLCLLQLGRFEEGFRLYESRKRLPIPVGLHHYPQPLWSGDEDIRGRILLVHAEQGLGDIIQFSRYIALLQDKGVKIILAVPDNLIRLLRSLPWSMEIVSADRPAPDFDYHVSLMSLPFAFRTILENIPADIPYLAAEPDLVRKWKDRIGDAGFKIGVNWQSSATGAAFGKSFPVSQYAGLSKIPGVRLISLQRHHEAGQMNDLPEAVEQLGPDFDGGADAFIDSAAVMQCLDLVITSDTAIAHLGGALGRPVWLALKYVPDWRWLLDRSDTPWYPAMRLFRQPANGDWDGLFEQMQPELAALIAGQG